MPDCQSWNSLYTNYMIFKNPRVSSNPLGSGTWSEEKLDCDALRFISRNSASWMPIWCLVCCVSLVQLILLSLFLSYCLQYLALEDGIPSPGIIACELVIVCDSYYILVLSSEYVILILYLFEWVKVPTLFRIHI